MSRRDEIRRTHIREPEYGHICCICDDNWPCDAAWLLDRLDKAERVIEAAQRFAHTRLVTEEKRQARDPRVITGIESQTLDEAWQRWRDALAEWEEQ